MSFLIIVHVLALLATCYSKSGSDSLEWLSDPSRWGGGWATADSHNETAALLHPFAAYFDNTDDNMEEDLYVKIFATSMTKIIPSVFLEWDHRLLKDISELRCNFHYLTEDKVLSVAVSVSSVMDSKFATSYDRASFSVPYTITCKLPPRSTFQPYPNAERYPFGVTLLHNIHRVITEFTIDYPPSRNGFYTLVIEGKESIFHNKKPQVVFNNAMDLKGLRLSGLKEQTDSQKTTSTEEKSKPSIAVCVSPVLGSDGFTTDYSDPDTLIAFINYHTSLGVNHFYIYNNLAYYSTASWMQKLRVLKSCGVEITFLPDMDSHDKKVKALKKLVYNQPHFHIPEAVPHYHDVRNGNLHEWINETGIHPNTTEHGPYFFVTLFPDICMQHAKHVHDYVIMLDYTDFLVIQDPFHSQDNSKPQPLLHMLHTLEQKYPTASHFYMQRAVLPKRPPGKDSTTAKDYYTTLQTSTRRTEFGLFGTSEEHRRFIANPARVNGCSKFQADPHPGYSLIDLTVYQAVILSYSETNYVKAPLYSPMSMPPYPYTAAADRTRSYPVDSKELVFDDRMTKRVLSMSLRESCVHKRAEEHLPSSAFLTPEKTRGLSLAELNAITTGTMHKAGEGVVYVNPISVSNFNELPPLASGVCADRWAKYEESPGTKLKSLLLFTTISTYDKHTYRFHRSQLAIASWLRLMDYSPSKRGVRVSLRVLLLVDKPSECTEFRNIFQSDDNRPESDLPKANFSSNFRSDTWKEHYGLHQPFMCLPATHCLHPFFGIPIVDCLHKSAIAVTHPGEFIMYSNSDIMFTTSLLDTFLEAASDPKLTNDFVFVGRRRNVNILDEEMFEFREQETSLDDYPYENWKSVNALIKEWKSSHSEGRQNDVNVCDSHCILGCGIVPYETLNMLRKIRTVNAKKERWGDGIMDSKFAIDYFLFPPHGMPNQYPPFMVGRASWDNIFLFWLHNNTFNATRPGPPIIDVSLAIDAVHLGKQDADMNNFSIRKGANWAIQLLTDWSRLEKGNILNTNMESYGSCSWPIRNCTLGPRTYFESNVRKLLRGKNESFFDLA